MTAPNTLTFDIAPPRRPSLDDCGGATLINDAVDPPDPQTMPYAEQLNQWAKQIARFGGSIAVARFSIVFSAGTPSIGQFVCLPTAPITGTFTVTDNGNGDTTISWPADTFPPSVLKPMVALNEDVAALAPVAWMPNATSVRVKTRDSAGTLADIGFTVEVS